MQLKRFTDLSLRMLMHLAHTAKPGEPVPVPVLAETLQWNPNLVIKAAHFMVKSGWLTAIRGRNGGLILARAADTYPIGDVVRILEGAEDVIDCSKPACPFLGNCALAPALRLAQTAFYEKPNEFTLKDLVVRKEGVIPVFQVAA